MKTITDLTGRVTEDNDWPETLGAKTGVHYEVVPGVFMHFHLGTAGLLIRSGEIRIAVPLAELLNLLPKTETPALTPGPVKKPKKA